MTCVQDCVSAVSERLAASFSSEGGQLKLVAAGTLLASPPPSWLYLWAAPQGCVTALTVLLVPELESGGVGSPETRPPEGVGSPETHASSSCAPCNDASNQVVVPELLLHQLPCHSVVCSGDTFCSCSHDCLDYVTSDCYPGPLSSTPLPPPRTILATVPASARR
jgi:hypothetical protein